MRLVCEVCGQDTETRVSERGGPKMCLDCAGPALPRIMLRSMLICAPLMRIGCCGNGHRTVTPSFLTLCPRCEQLAAKEA